MIELSSLLFVIAIFFGYVGWMRGLTKELISTAGIILSLFALHQFDTLLRGVLLGNLPPDQRFYIQTAIFLTIVYFSYQTRALVGADAQRARAGGEGRDAVQTSALGAIVGFANGYLIAGSVWYFLHINSVNGVYPLDPYIIAPPAGSSSALFIANLPLFVLAGGPQGPGDLLALCVIVLFVIVLVMI